jgi:diguanylate cyclase (GGDEF)-like protein
LALKDSVKYHGDVVARYGGEEFAIILPCTRIFEAMNVAERAVKTVLETGIAHDTTDIADGVVTISAGYSTLTSSGKAGEAEQLKQEADKALYQAKRSGRNRALAWKEMS